MTKPVITQKRKGWYFLWLAYLDTNWLQQTIIRKIYVGPFQSAEDAFSAAQASSRDDQARDHSSVSQACP